MALLSYKRPIIRIKGVQQLRLEGILQLTVVETECNGTVHFLLEMGNRAYCKASVLSGVILAISGKKNTKINPM